MKLHWVHFSLFMIFLLAAGQLSAQQTTKALKVHHAQLTPHFLQKIQDQGDQVTDFTISVHSYEAFLEKIESLGLQKAVKKNYPYYQYGGSFSKARAIDSADSADERSALCR
jgi:hypothetical protein